MNYQHAYHVGHISDVFKHIVLIQLLKFLQKKDSGLCYMETHAAKALYDLNDSNTQKTNEYKQGIEQLWSNSFTNPAIIDYLKIVQEFNSEGKLNYYPGSGLIARSCLREQDEEVLCELHPPIYEDLRAYFRKDRKVHVHQGDGYQIISSLLPPKVSRGIVLIDPPYEAANEYQQLLISLNKMHARWQGGVYAIWFPIKKSDVLKDFYRALKKLPFNNILSAELRTSTPDSEATDNRLKGSGLVIINPPWQFDQMLSTLLPALAKSLNIQEQGKTSLHWLKKEINKF